MPYPEGHKDKVRHEIITSAAEAFRENGIRESSVPSIMRGAGLTHGGFYSHFTNKEELIAETCSNIVSQMIGALQAAVDHSESESKINVVIDYYLSTEHRDHGERGCIVPILSGEISQSSDAIKTIFSQELNRYIEFIAEISGLDKTMSGAILSVMVGSLILARGIKDPVLSDSILEQGKIQAKLITQ